MIVYADGRESLFLRSQFHSAKDENNYVNLAPPGGIHVSFASEAIWYPLELTQFIKMPDSYVVLDILTSQPLDSKLLPKEFSVGKTGRMNYQNRPYSVTRVTAKLGGNRKWPDLRLKIPAKEK